VSDCSHGRRHLVWTQVSGWDAEPIQTRQLRYQCPDCGQLFGGAQRHALASPATPEVDIDLLKRYLEHREEERLEQLRLFHEQREAQSEEWRAWYQEYLGTTAWRDRRSLVLRRANGTCEGCGEARATEVHHLTYAHVGNEFLWELVAVCRDCHERFHGKSK
jgi:hypothetical protein